MEMQKHGGAEPRRALTAFPAGVYANRRAVTRRRMMKEGYDALFVSDAADINYLWGLEHEGGFADQPVLFPLHGRSRIVARWMEHPTIRAQLPGVIHVPYTDRDDDNPADAMVEAIVNANLASARIGMDEQSRVWSVRVLDRLRDQTPGVTWVDSSDLVLLQRMVKSNLEIERMRRGAGYFKQALLHGLGELRKRDLTERELDAIIYAEMLRLGSGHPAFPTLLRAGLERIVLEHVLAGNYPLLPGEPFMIEGSAQVDWLHAPMSGIFYIGAAPDGYDDVAEVARLAFEAVLRVLRPGNTFEAAHEEWEATVAKLGYPRYRHQAAYGVGVGARPSWTGQRKPYALRRGTKLRLREYMTFHTFSWIFGQEPGEPSAGESATVMVTRDGGVPLERLPLERVIPR